MTAQKITGNILQRLPRAYLFFGIFCTLFIALMVFVEINNGKFWTNDLKVYFDATKDYFDGNNPYKKPYGLSSGYFKYPPTTLYFFWGLSNLNYFLAQIFHVILLGIALIGSISILHFSFLHNKSGETSNRRFALLYIAFILIIMHVVREFHMGNVNLLLLFLFVLGIRSLSSKKYFYVGLFWSLMVILKPIVILAFVPLILFQNWRVIFYLAGFGILYFLLPIIQNGWNGNLELWSSWIQSVSKHGDYIKSENSLTYLANYYFEIKSTWIPSIVIFVLLISAMIVTYIRNNKNYCCLIEFSIVFLAFTPNFFVTDTEHFLLTLPLLVLLIKMLIEEKNKIYWFILFILLIPFSFNMNDLLGHNISDIIDESGMLGISNLGFIFLYFLLSIKGSRELKLNSI